MWTGHNRRELRLIFRSHTRPNRGKLRRKSNMAPPQMEPSVVDLDSGCSATVSTPYRIGQEFFDQTNESSGHEPRIKSILYLIFFSKVLIFVESRFDHPLFLGSQWSRRQSAQMVNEHRLRNHLTDTATNDLLALLRLLLPADAKMARSVKKLNKIAVGEGTLLTPVPVDVTASVFPLRNQLVEIVESMSFLLTF